ncbi:hypothetical protein Pcinc_037641 [Petrolisthes cinctipes]|uniref:HIT domain-containing protein n=1 Tax=Petrolisthes cinctipes TaxID=88211 RepID=A0AAE1EL56_PETCI|nr:hypothetical protein Pcinc_037641 [Petrolisthes cinctipes]
MAVGRIISLSLLGSSLWSKACVRGTGVWQARRTMSDEVNKAKEAAGGAGAKSEPTIFDHILSGKIPADIVYEDEKCMAFRDVAPQAPKHILLIPRIRIPTLDDATWEHAPLLGHLMVTAKEIAAKEGLDKGYRIVINNGVEGSQSVYHLHIHIIGGRQMGWPPG